MKEPVKAFVLIQTQIGKTGEVVAALRNLKGVASVESVSGPYDAIAVLKSQSMRNIGDLIVSIIQPIKGISRIVTCVVV